MSELSMEPCVVVICFGQQLLNALHQCMATEDWRQEVRQRLDWLSQRLDQLELSGRRLNAIFLGVAERKEENEAWRAAADVINRRLGMRMEVGRSVRRVYRLGEERNRGRPLLVVFRRFRDRQAVLQAAHSMNTAGDGITVYGYAPPPQSASYEAEMSVGTTEESIKLWLKVGNLKKLEAAVLDGYGNLLRGKNSRIPKINKFLKRVPHYQAKIASIHAAASSGDVRELENLLDRKGLAFARGPDGETLLQTAIIHQQMAMVNYVLEKYPTLLLSRDHSGRGALHYAAMVNDDDRMYQLLLAAGADKEVKDVKNKTALDYKNNRAENRWRLEANDGLSQDRKNWNRRQSQETLAALLRQPSPIAPLTKTEVKSLIAKGDIARLERSILHGYGERLLGETATSTRMRNLIDSVPQHLDKLTAIKTAIERGSLRDVKSLLNRKCLVLARDGQGLTVLHHAVINDQHDIAQYLISLSPRAVFAKDHDKRTPVHYAAVLADDAIYKMLNDAGGNISLPDCDGKTPEYYRQNPGALVDNRGSEGSAKKANSVASNGSNSNNRLHVPPNKNVHRSAPSSSSSRNSGSSLVKMWLKSGDMEKLEKAVIDGHGLKLIRETTSDPRARAFLRTVPAYMSKIAQTHEAVCQGSLRNLKVVCDRKKLFLSRDQLGLGLLHKALLFGHEDIVRFLLENYPQTIHIKDKSGRSAIHYAAALSQPDHEKMYQLLVDNGADPQAPDSKGKSAEWYLSNKDQLDVREIVNRVNRQRNRHQQSVANNKHMTSPNNKNGSDPNAVSSNSLQINGGNIRKWIHAEDLGKLEQVVLDGQGYKLLLETSNNPRVKQFLIGVPALVNKLKEVHSATCANDVASLEQALEKSVYLKSKDEAGMTPLHKAVLLENDDVVNFIIGHNADTLGMKDEEGRTPVHYAAGLKDGGRVYSILVEKITQSPVDNRGRTAEHYLRNPGELDMRQLIAHAQRNRAASKVENSQLHTTRRPTAPNNLRPVRKSSGNGVSSETIAKAIQMVDLDKLEQLVLDGHGKRLLGKTSWSEEVRAFLKKVPQYMDKIYALHTAAATGDLLSLQQLLDKKAMANCRDEYGLTALHKAVKYGQMDVAKYLLQTFPASHATKDQDGRTPLHYAAIYKGRDDIYRMLINSGADSKVQDQRGKSAEHYLLSSTKLEAPTIPRSLSEAKISTETSSEEEGSDRLDEERQLNEWLEQGDVEQLERLVLEGRGDKLLGRSSDNSISQEFLESVPAYMGKMRAVHNAAASGEIKDLQSILQDKASLAGCLDEQGASPLHRAVLHGHKDAMKFLANTYPHTLKIADKSGLTPLHYAAMVNDDGYFYRLLHNFGADPNIKDKSGLTPGQMLRGTRITTLEELAKRYDERKVPPRPHSVQTWERPPTEELLRALTPSPMTVAALNKDNSGVDIVNIEEVTKPTHLLNGNDTDKEESEQQGALEDVEYGDKVGMNELENDENGVKPVSKDTEIIASREEQEEATENGGDNEDEKEDGYLEENSDDLMKILDEPKKENENLGENLDDEVENLDEKVESLDRNDEVLNKNDDVLSDRVEILDGKNETDNNSDEKDDYSGEKYDNLYGKDDNLVEKDDILVEKDDILVEKDDNLDEKEDNSVEKEDNSDEKEDKDQNEPNDVADEEELIKNTNRKNEILDDNDENNKILNGTDENLTEVDEDNGNLDEKNENLDEMEANSNEKDANLNEKDENADENVYKKFETSDILEGNDDVSNENDDVLGEKNDETNEVVENANEIDKIVDKELDDQSEVTKDQNLSVTIDEDSDTPSEAKRARLMDGNDVDDRNDIEETPATIAVEDEKLEAQPLIGDDKRKGTIVLEDEESVKEESKIVDEVDNDEERKVEEEESRDDDKGTIDDEDNDKSQALVSQGSVESDSEVVMMVEPPNHHSSSAPQAPTITPSFLPTPSVLSTPWSMEGDYLSTVLGDALIVAMAEVSRVRPPDPVAYLALLLYRYVQKNGQDGQRVSQLTDGPMGIKELSELKSDTGESLLHFALSRRQHQETAFDELLAQTGFNVALRDGAGRTLRDVATEDGQTDAVTAVDRHVFHLVRQGQLEEVENLIYDGYDHLLDILDEEGNDVIIISELNQQMEMTKLLQRTGKIQENIQLLCQAVQDGHLDIVRNLLTDDPRLALAKNPKGQTPVHLALLKEDEEMTTLLATLCPLAVNSGDNMQRTALHYAMGTAKSHTLAKLLMDNGASLTTRDAV